MNHSGNIHLSSIPHSLQTICTDLGFSDFECQLYWYILSKQSTFSPTTASRFFHTNRVKIYDTLKSLFQKKVIYKHGTCTLAIAPRLLQELHAEKNELAPRGKPSGYLIFF